MKSTKKVLAVLLATAMIFAVCAMPAFADVRYTTRHSSEYIGYLHDYSNGTIEAEGNILFISNSRLLYYAVYGENLTFNQSGNFRLHAQCAVNYSDDTQDFYNNATHVCIIPGNLKKSAVGQAQLSFEKTIVSFDGEFFVWYEDEIFWEAQLYVEYIPGINA